MTVLAEQVKNALVSVITETGDVAASVRNVTQDTLVKSVKGVSAVTTSGLEAITDVVSGGVHAFTAVGTSLTTGVIGLMHGSIIGAKDIGVTSAEATGQAASTIIKTTSQVGGDLGATAVAAVEGSIHAAQEIGEDSGELAKHAVLGTLRAADEIGSETGTIVRKALLNAAALPHDVIDALLTGKTE